MKTDVWLDTTALVDLEFRSAVATSDSWERHEGVEILFMRSGEACWEMTDDDHFTVVLLQIRTNASGIVSKFAQGPHNGVYFRFTGGKQNHALHGFSTVFDQVSQVQTVVFDLLYGLVERL